VLRVGLKLLLLVLLSGTGASASDPAAAMVFVRVFGDVTVEFEEAWKQPMSELGVEVATGSGFVIAPAGLILTNHHVVSGSRRMARVQGENARVTTKVARIEVVVGSGEERRTFEPWLAAQDAGLDLAVLQVNASDLPYVPFGDSDAVEPGRATKVLGFPFGRGLEVGREAGPDVVPEATVTGGSLSAARADEEGGTRFLQTDATMHPGSSGGPMLDEDGYLIGVVKMKVAAGRGEPGPGFGVPVNLVKDFLEAQGLLSQLPTARLRRGVVHGLEWKKFGIELPDSQTDRSPARLRLETGDSDAAVSVRVERVATPWTTAELEEALLQGTALPGFVPSPAASRRRWERDRPPGVLGSAVGTAPDGRPFAIEYSIVDLGREKLVASYSGPPDDIAFNLSLIRGSLRTLEAQRLLTREVRAPFRAVFEPVPYPGPAAGDVPMPAGWVSEPTTSASCEPPGGAGAGLAASPPGDFTVVLRVLVFDSATVTSERLAAECAGQPGRATARRSRRLGADLVTRSVVLSSGEVVLLLEAEAPEAKATVVAELFDAWVRQVAEGAPRPEGYAHAP
jgi:S1-C subfamily serine protease